MKELRRRLVKFSIRLSPELSESELEERIAIARQVAENLVYDEEWKDRINRVYLFGSTAKRKARGRSDLDLAIVTWEDFFFGIDYTFITGQLMDCIYQIKEICGISEKMRIEPVIIAESWLEDPEGCGFKNPAFFDNVKNDGLLLWEKDEV